MVWEGANVRQSVESVEDTNAVTAAGAGNKRYTKETVEAALSRLHTSYATAMECLGAWHRADQALRRGDSIAQTEQRPGSQAGTLRDVGQTTRQLFESALLRNPLVAQHAPAFHDYYSKDYVWEAPPTLTSAGHRETVRRVAYLSLVNYADLLLSGCACPIPRLPPRTGQKKHLLDKGITQPLATFQEEKHCCWNRPRNDTETSPVGDSDTEDPVETTRRALTVLLDATALDPTDPLVWLKLSCLARRLGRLKTAVAMKDDTLLLPYRRLERHGLEMARIALPPNVPPNRLVLRALVELEEEETIFFTNGYDSGPLLQDVMEIRLSIPRYSWSILGRMLMRVCREGNLYTVTATAPHTNSHRHRGLSGPLRSAPLVRLELSPLLAVPSMVLAGICQFLTPAELARLEMTCRGLSYAVIAARAVHDHEQDLRASRQGNLNPAKLAPLGSGQPKPVVAETASDNRSTEVILEVDPNGDAATTDVNRKSRKKDHQTEEKRENQRVSKRVRSQMITSGKRAERSSRRSSLEYCVVAATMDCAPGDSKYDQLRREKIDWDHLLGLPPTPSALSAYWARSLADPTPLRTISLDVFPRDRQARERISSSSLTSFVNEWGGLDKPERRAVTPLGLLFGFVAHASLHVSDIFNSETGGPVVLSTCLIECFEFMVRRTRTSFSLTPCWSTCNRKAPGRLNSMNVFAVDLLHVELRLKRCERDDSGDTELDGDASFLSRSVPVLVSLVDDLDEIYSGPSFAKLWVVLKVRCLWLAAAFYMWRGRIALCVFESREAEKEGLTFVAKLLDLMVKAQVGAVLTPHLESPTRSGLHWRELSVSSLRTYQNEIQASSVVLLAQEKFSQALCNIADEGDAVIDPISIDSLVAIGNLILDRYRVPVGSSEDKYSELITDFISSTGAMLVSSQFSVHPGTVQQDSIGSECDDLLPARNPAARQLKNMTNPSILAILNTCLLLDKDKRLDATYLLMRLVASIRNSKKALVLELAQSRYDASKDGESLSEDSSLFSDISTDKNEGGEFGKQLLLRQYATTATLLLHRIRELFVLRLTEQQKVQISNSEEFRDTLASSFDICRSYASTAIWFNELSEETPADLNVLLSTIALLTAVQNAGLVLVPEELERNYFIGLASILEQQRSTIASLMDCELSRQERVAHQKVASHRARVAGSVSFHIGQIFAAHLCTPSSRQLVASSFFDELSIPSLVIASTIDSLLWFRDLSVKDDHQSRAAASLRNFCFSLDRASRETLLVPTALAIVGTIGALASTKDGKLLPAKKECLRNTDLAEFFDSDDSAVDWLSDDSVVADKVGHEELLRSISQSVHAISLVFQSLSAETMLTYKDTKEYATEHGPLLPLLAARVLNMYADRLLTEFLEDPEKGTSTLSSDFPFGTRSVGVLLDSVLYKVYKCLHGFSFVNMRDGKEYSGPTIIDFKQRTFLPEDAKATAALYSCMMRSYGQGRKSPPKSALELLTRALPSAMESDLSRTVRRFVFSTANGRIGANDIVSIINQDGERRADFKCFENWHWEKLHEMEDIKEEKDELLAVRRGVSHFLAQGPLPTYQDGAPNVRAASAKAEEALSRKFNAILDDLCHGSIADCKGWYKAAQCLLVRSDLIADRLGLSKGFVRSDHFNVPEWKGFVYDTLAIEELLKRQSEEASIHTKHWVEFLGPDLSIFLHYNWSSFESLRALATEMEASLSHFVETDDADTLKAREAWDEIEHLFRTKDFVAWQEAWGGLFVSSLRQLAARCMALGLYILNQSLGHGDLENKVVLSELTESLGMSLYAELMGSQLYGYPMQEMPQGQKRCIATAALACFSHSVHMSRSVNLDKPADMPRATWDILFMIGKCNEKIASTYRAERFSFSAIDLLNKQGTRLYEQHMNNAFESYSISLSEAREIEREGGLIFEQNGGSAHGSTEVLYRLHASRLKCLIAAVDRREDERASAEEEALRLTEKYWFSAPQLDSRRSDARERIWAVLADTVSALAQCRSEHSFFHRSVYRHAQALMWAPVLNDPINERPNGSFGAVPGTKAVKVRGLNSATNAADSGAVVMSTLFDKKRSQLCAVWVANGSASSFQSINNSVRKYDCLRGKYISAYLECLKLSKRRSDLETFLRWTASCHRDLPSYFAASAFTQGSSPVKSHTQDSLIVRTRSLSSYHFLTSTKRLANTALANVILQEISGPSDRKDPETQLKAAYGCFLRLNSDPDAFIKCKWWKYHRSPSGMRPIADALMHAYKKIAKSQSPSTNQSDWGEGQTSETLRLSLRKCKELFPSATGSFLSSKASMNKSKRKVDREANGSGTKRKEPDGTFTALRSFVVPVPKGLSSTDTFLTSINIGSTTKKLRLTVPEGEPATLRFSLRVPVSDEPDCGADASSHL